ncbi:J domain-containing protein [Sphingomicrobium nitratireducens]|uniref:J domain-containing protein n=1 Tax=Sphingomicrobium nitratireducens TaxID=2964666 RepID=UPI00223F8D4D|nr:J domain-containing protein [Sphingomicrobium nitratireducens]
MTGDDGFTDYYALLQVSPDCDPKMLEVAFHYFAKIYHPDRVETADVDKFTQVRKAYDVLSDPETRSVYDSAYIKRGNGQAPKPVEGVDFDEKAAVDDAEKHARLLFELYKRRRANGAEPGLGGWQLQESLGCSDNQFAFHVWYLKSKKLIETTEQGTIAITVEGVDHVISTSRTEQAVQRMISQSEGSNED